MPVSLPLDGHASALAKLKQLMACDPASSDARSAFAALEVQKPLKLLIVCVDADTAVWTDDACTAAKLVAEPSDLLLEIVAAARAPDWEKVIFLIHNALSPHVIVIPQ